jgi:hypothetical protein
MLIKCLVCGKVLEPIADDHNMATVKARPWMALYINANTWEVSCNYGSCHDTDKFMLGLCDDCISIKIDAGLLIHNGTIRNDIEDIIW